MVSNTDKDLINKMMITTSTRLRAGRFDEGMIPSFAEMSMGINPDMMRREMPSAQLGRIMQEVEYRSRKDQQFAEFLAGAARSDITKYTDLQENLKEMTETLERIQKEPLLTHKVLKLSDDKKWLFVKKADQELRVVAPSGLERGHVVLLHPKSMQVVENLGFPPLEASEFCPTVIPNTRWDDIGGLEDAKRDMIEVIEMPHKQKDLVKFYNKKPVKGILLTGQPGCGKTMLGKAAARAIADIYKVTTVGKDLPNSGFMYVKGPEILNSYVGATEETIRELFIDASRHFQVHGYPAIIFIDEADAILAARGGFGFSMSNTIVPSFLTEMDGLEESSAIIILATNRPEALDPAIVREGRIDRKIHVSRPDRINSTIIAAMNLSKYPIAKGYELDNLAEGLVYGLFADDKYLQHGDEPVLLSDIINGAMLATCVDLAVSAAIHRDINTTPTAKKKSNAGTGICPEDILDAVEKIFQQNKLVNHNTTNIQGASICKSL